MPVSCARGSSGPAGSVGRAGCASIRWRAPGIRGPAPHPRTSSGPDRDAQRDKEAVVVDDTQRASMPSPAELSARVRAAAIRDEAGPAADVERGPVEPGQTGDAAVDEALRVLDGLAERPLTEHVAAFDAVHGALQDRLAEAQG